jgi:hypothetical protein
MNSLGGNKHCIQVFTTLKWGDKLGAHYSPGCTCGWRHPNWYVFNNLDIVIGYYYVHITNDPTGGSGAFIEEAMTNNV